MTAATSHAQASPLPIHARTKPLAGWIERIAAWYANSFGTPTCFAVSLALLTGWVVLIPVMGYARWNIGPGLLGNTIESTGEWFFEVAILIVGVTTAARQRQIESNQLHQIDHMTQMLAALQTAEDRNAELAGRLSAANADLTRQVRELTVAVRQLTSDGQPPASPPGGA